MARLVIVLFALIHGWGSYAKAVSSSHDRAFRSDPGVAALEVHVGGHGHSHEVRTADDGDSERHSGHDAADHSHDKSNLPRNGAQETIGATEDWSLDHQVPPYRAPFFAFDRPPKYRRSH